MKLSETLRNMARAGCSIEQLISFVAASETPKSSTQRRKVSYTPDFEAFWKAYPTDANMSKLEAFEVWQRIEPEERVLAMRAIEPFKQWIKSQDGYRPIHACRFLSKQRYVGHAAQPDLKVVASNPGKHILRDSPEWGEFAEAYRAEHGKYPPIDKRGGWFFKEASGE